MLLRRASQRLIHNGYDALYTDSQFTHVKYPIKPGLLISVSKQVGLL